MTDRLFITCHICGNQIAGTRVEDGKTIAPSTAIRWHEKVIAHIRREHLRKTIRS